jgi:hypothetical protein
MNTQSGLLWFRLWTILIVVSLSSIACCFFLEGLAYEENLVADYAVWAVDTRAWTAIVEKDDHSGASAIIGPMIYAYGWNNDFIIARQHPNPDYDVYDINTRVTNWYIVGVKTGNVYGPLSEEEYGELRIKLGVPEDLVFTRTVEP